MRYVWRVLMVAVLALSLGQECTLPDLAGGTGGQTSNGALDGINGGLPAGRGIPELGGLVAVQIVSESSVDARVLVRYLVGETESHRSELEVPAMTTLAPIGPDLATVIEVSGSFNNGTPIAMAPLVLGSDFFENDLRQIVLRDPSPCPESGKAEPGICGCDRPDTDTDGDGTPDCVDQCPENSAKTAPGACGCGQPDADSDGDGVLDCDDLCPHDSAKTVPGACGCEHGDIDTDGDETLDCLDGCPLNSGKTSPGACGCDQSDMDYDADGTADCNDGCPMDPSKIAPGACGCHRVEEDLNENGVIDCLEIDLDDDGILDDGDLSGVAGDNPCMDGLYMDCDDNCPRHYNPDQRDDDSDGVGSECEIRADFDYDGDVDMDDFGFLQACKDNQMSPGMCGGANVDNDPLCRINDADIAEFSRCLTGADVPLEGTAPPACYGEEVGRFCYESPY